VEVSAPPRSKRPGWRRLAEVPRRQHGEQQANRYVDEQHPAPRQPRGEHPAGEQADGPAGPGHRREHPEGPVALAALGEVGGDQGQRGRGGDGAADPLECPGRQQPAGGGGQAPDERGEGEQQDAGDEHPAAAQDVAGAATEQQQPAEGQGVGVQHPGQVGGGEAEGLLDLGQGDIHDGHVQYHHELGRRDDRQRHGGVVAPPCRRLRPRDHAVVPFASMGLPCWMLIGVVVSDGQRRHQVV
jgi:hypothetical protein